MTFEDIIGDIGDNKSQGGPEQTTETSGTLPTTGYSCPVCASTDVTRGGMYMGLDDLYRQYVECNSCKNNWIVVFSEDQSQAWIDTKA
jgi:hypothetical protein